MNEFWRRVWMILTLRCDSASLLTSESLDRELLLHERWALSGHHFVCGTCKHMKEQFEAIRTIERHRCDQAVLGADESSLRLSPEARSRIKRACYDRGSNHDL